MFTEQIGPQMAIPVQHRLAEGGDILRRKLLRQKIRSYVICFNVTYVEMGKPEIGRVLVTASAQK